MSQKSDSVPPENKISIREKIIQTTMNLISKSREIKFTIRDIIKEAGVNVAAVNYYFGSKKKLLEEIYVRFLTKIGDLNLTITEKNLSPQENLFLWFDGLLAYLIHNPGMIHIMRKNFDLDLPITEKINKEYLDFLVGNLTLINKNNSQVENKHTALQLISAIIFPLFYPLDALVEIYDLDLCDISIRQSFITTILSNFKLNIS